MDCAEGNTLVPTWTYRGFFFQTCLLLLFKCILYYNTDTYKNAIALKRGYLHVNR